MIKSDFHVHTNYCDGQNSPEEMVLSAIDKGFSSLGFSVHSYTDFDTRYCIEKERIDEYKQEISALKEKYKGEIKIFCGVEQDYYSNEPTDDFDYVIGSVHYVKSGENYLAIDDSPEDFEACAEKYFGGDYIALCEEYFKTVSRVIDKTGANIIGHFDLVAKFNEGNRFFDENDPRYIKAYKQALNSLIPYNIPFEINTGAISRGYKAHPYPNADMIKYIRENGGKFILASDSHLADTIGFEFSKWEKYIKK